VHNAAFLLGIHPELPDVNDQDLEELSCMRVVESCSDGMADSQAIKAQLCQELEKGDLRICLTGLVRTLMLC
jgi:hypothetical protein